MRTCLRKVRSGERLEFAVAQSPGNMKVSVQAARSIGTRRAAAAGVEDGRKFATRSRCVKLTSQCPHRAPLMPSFPAANRRMGLIDRFSSPMTPARQVICSSGGRKALIGGARRIVRRLHPKNNFARRFNQIRKPSPRKIASETPVFARRANGGFWPKKIKNALSFNGS